MKRIAWYAGISTLAVSLAAAPAIAGGGDPRIELAPSSATAEASGGVSHGDTVSFALSNPRTSRPEVRLVCGPDAAYYPPSRAVLDQTLPYYGSGTREFVLASAEWTDGGNTCVAWMMRKGEPQVGVLFWVNG
jgi:hypothetical protein